MRINVTRSSMPPMEEYVEEIRSLWDSHWLTNNGEKLKKLEAALKERLDVPYAALFTNGHLALEALLKALGLKGEVITTPFTFASTTHAIVRAGLTPVFCDIREDDYTMDPAKVEASQREMIRSQLAQGIGGVEAADLVKALRREAKIDVAESRM